MTLNDLYFEDFHVGRKFETESATLSEADIIDFGRRYAPLPYHTDPAAAQDTMFKGVVAAGFQTAALCFGLFVRTGAFRVAGMGSPGIDKLRWLKPVRPGDTLRVIAEVIESSPAVATGGRDAIRMKYDTLNQRGEIVMTLTSLHFLRRRPAR